MKNPKTVSDEEIMVGCAHDGSYVAVSVVRQLMAKARQAERESWNCDVMVVKAFENGKAIGREEREQESSAMLAQTVMLEGDKTKDDRIKALEADKKTLDELIRVLSLYCGEDGDNEGAIETLNRLLAELGRRRKLIYRECKHEKKSYDCPFCFTAREDFRRREHQKDSEKSG